MQAAREWLDALLAVTFAPLCAACDAPLRAPTRGCVCGDCWEGITPDVPPAHDILAAFGGVVRSGASAGVYEGSLRAIIQALKYDGRRSLARPLGQRMRAASHPLLVGASAVVPVPLHRSRRRERGFNQAADLAAHLGPPVVHALARARRTQPQAGLTADERRANVAGSFVGTRAAAELGGAAVVLVDDVWTTGATLGTCARVLLEAGAREVRVVTAARVAPSSR